MNDTAPEGRLRKRLLVLAAIAVAANLVVVGVDRLAPDLPHEGPAGSSFSTYQEGLSAYAELLARNGVAVTQLTQEPADLDPASTVVVVGALITDPERAALDSFVEQGGRLIVDAETQRLAVGDDPSPVTYEVLADTVETRGVTSVAGTGPSLTTPPADAVALLGANGDVAAVTVERGLGVVVVLADWSMLTNTLLADADNAAFGLAISADRPVIFDEFHHGYIEAPIARGFPDSWRWTLRLLAVAVAVWMVAISARFGPIEAPDRTFPPARKLYVDAVAATLERTGDPAGAAEPLRRHARTMVSRRAGLGADAGPDDFRQAGVTLGLDPEHVAAIVGTGTDDADALAAGRAVAALHKGHIIGNQEGTL